MTGEFKFHLSIVWMILIPSLKTPFWAKLSTTAGKVDPVEMRLIFRPCSTCPHMGNVAMKMLRRRGHSQRCPAAAHQLIYTSCGLHPWQGCTWEHPLCTSWSFTECASLVLGNAVPHWGHPVSCWGMKFPFSIGVFPWHGEMWVHTPKWGRRGPGQDTGTQQSAG